MNIAFLTTRMDKPSGRYRFLQYVPYLEAEGLSVESFVIPKGILRRRRLFSSLKDFDVVFLQKRLFGAFDWRSLRRCARYLVYDFDDAVVFNDSSKAAQRSSARSSRFERVISGADMVIAGNGYLEGLAKGFTDNVVIIPTPVDTERYIAGGEGVKGGVTIGWIGSRATIGYLEPYRILLGELHERYPDMKFKVVSDEFPDWPEYDGSWFIKKRWNYDDEVADIQSFDIGIMPLNDDEWTRGKCGFKLLQYMSSGISAVASPVGVNTEIIEDGRNGLLASSGEEWVEAIAKLIEDAALREVLGKAARRTIEERYSMKVNAPKLLEVLKLSECK